MELTPVRRLRARLVPALPSGTAWVLFAALSAYHYWRFLQHPSTSIPGSGDGVLYAWYFEWIAQSFTHVHNPLFSHAMNAPYGFNLMWNTSLLGLATLCVPLTLTLGPFTTVGILMTISPLVSAGVAYLVVRDITRSWPGAVIAGLIYGFGPYFAGQSGHLNLIFAPFPPLLLWLLWRLLVLPGGAVPRSADQDGSVPDADVPRGAGQNGSGRRLVGRGLLLGVAAGIQFLVSEEILVLSGIVAAGGLLAAAITHPGLVLNTVRRVRAAIGVAIPAAAVIVALPVAYQLAGPGALVSGVAHARAQADLISLVRPSLLQVGAPHADIRANLATRTANGAENTGYLGWPLIVLCVLLVGWSAFRRERFAGWWILTAAGTIALSLGSPMTLYGRPLATGPWALVESIPFLGSAVPVRFSGITALLIGLLLARSLAGTRGLRFVLILGAALTAIAPWRVVAPFPSDPLPATPRFFTTSTVREIPAGSTVLVLPYPAFPDVEAMVWQVRSNMRFDLIGGYSVFRHGTRSSYFASTPGFARVLMQAGSGTHISQARVDTVRGSVGSSGVRFIVVTPGAGHRANVIATAERITGCIPRPVADVILCEIPSHHRPGSR